MGGSWRSGFPSKNPKDTFLTPPSPPSESASPYSSGSLTSAPYPPSPTSLPFNLPDPPPQIPTTFDWERSSRKRSQGYSNRYTTLRWSGIVQSLGLNGTTPITTSGTGNGNEGTSLNVGYPNTAAAPLIREEADIVEVL
jgi:hypothetical protein